jgi:hypothetical protein
MRLGGYSRMALGAGRWALGAGRWALVLDAGPGLGGEADE